MPARKNRRSEATAVNRPGKNKLLLTIDVEGDGSGSTSNRRRPFADALRTGVFRIAAMVVAMKSPKRNCARANPEAPPTG